MLGENLQQVSESTTVIFRVDSVIHMGIQRRAVLGSMSLAAFTLSGCLSRDESTNGVDGGRGELTVAVTTSTYDAGLLDELHSTFESTYNVSVRTISGGTGETIATGERGDADAVMAHAPPLEAEFLESGYGINRRDVTVGDFIIAGPEADPAGVKDTDTASEAFERIATAEAPFLSRGDTSGTHVKELEVWAESDDEPDGGWYSEAGQGMGETLIQAGQMDAYVLSVRGNFVDMRDRTGLELLLEGPLRDGDPMLENPYGIIAVNPAKHETVDYELAMLYVGFLTGVDGQAIIDAYRIDGEQVFLPSGLSTEPSVGQYHPESANVSTEGGT